MSKKFQFFALFVMLLCSIIVAPFHSMIVHAQTTYPITKDGYEQWLRDNDKDKRNVTCPEYDRSKNNNNSKGSDKLGMELCQCTSWVVFNLLQSGVSENFIRGLGLGNAGEWQTNKSVRDISLLNQSNSDNTLFKGQVPVAGAVLEIGGHVMMVTKVNSATQVVISEYNWGENKGDYNTRTLNLPNNYSFLYFPNVTHQFDLKTGRQNPYYFLLNVEGNDDLTRRKGLDATDWGSGYIGTPVQTWDMAAVGGANQAWYLLDAGDNSYYIKPYHNDSMCLDVQGASTDNAARLQIFWCNKGDNQRFIFEYVGKRPASSASGWVDAYRIIAKHSGKAIDVRDNQIRNGAVVHQWSKTDGVSTQIWRLQTEDATKLRSDSECQRIKITDFIWPKACAAEIPPTPTPVVVPSITFPSNGHVFRDAWSFSWSNASNTNFFKICRDGNPAECVVYERRSGGSYQSNSASWAKQQTGKWCATVGVTDNGPWSNPVCFTMDPLRITSPSANQTLRGWWEVRYAGNGSQIQICDASFRNCLVNESVSGGVYRARDEWWARIQRGTYYARVGASSNGPWSDAVPFSVDNTVTIGGGLFRISVTGSNQSLDVIDRRDKNGQGVQIWEFSGNGGSNQKWRIEQASDGYYYIRPSASFSNRCLDVSGNSSGNGAQLQIYSCHWGANQQFRFIDMGKGRYSIQARHSGKVFDVKSAKIKNGSTVQQYDAHGGNNQLWQLISVR